MFHFFVLWCQCLISALSLDVIGKVSQEEQKLLHQIQATFANLFPPHPELTKNGWVFESKKDFAVRVKEVANRFGFVITNPSGNKFACSLAAAPAAQGNKSKKRSTQMLERGGKPRQSAVSPRCGCGFYIKISIASATIERNLGIPAGRVKVLNCNYLHSNGCVPCNEQLVVQKSRLGLYSRPLQADDLAYLIRLVATNPHVPAVIMRNAMRPLYPESVPLDAQRIANLRVKIKVYIKNRGYQKDFFEVPQADMEFLLGDGMEVPPNLTGESVDENRASFVDEATRAAKEQLLELLKDPQGQALNIENYLTRLNRIDPAFTSVLSRDSEGHLTGVIWMSPVQRANFERFGSTLFLDMMKRQLNSVHWPYTSVVAFNSEKKMVTCAEAFCCQEANEAYKWCLESICSMAPARPIASIQCIFGDGFFFGGALLRELGILDTCNLILDQYHLMEEDWPKKLGGAGYFDHYLKDPLYSYIKSPTLDVLQEKEDLIRGLLSHKPQWLNYFEREVVPKKKHLCYCYIKNYPGE